MLLVEIHLPESMLENNTNSLPPSNFTGGKSFYTWIKYASQVGVGICVVCDLSKIAATKLTIVITPDMEAGILIPRVCQVTSLILSSG
jgi:hypothetical protein